MKKILFPILIFVTAACAKDIRMQEATPERHEMEFCAGITRTSLNTYSVLWERGDEISVFDGVSNERFSTSGSGATATFKGKACDADQYIAVYPYDEGTTFSNGTVTTTIQTQQSARAGSFGRGANLSMAVSEGNTLNMKNVCGYLKFKIANGGRFNKIAIRAIGGEKLAGPFNVSFNSEGTPEIQPAEGAVDSVAMYPGTETFAAGAYYVALAPCTLTAGLELTLTGVDGNQYRKQLGFVDRIGRNVPVNIGPADSGISVYIPPVTLTVDFASCTFSPALPTAGSTTPSTHQLTIDGKTYEFTTRCAYYKSSCLLFKGLNGSTYGYFEFPGITGLSLKKVSIDIKAHSSNHSIKASITDAAGKAYSNSFYFNENAATSHDYILGENGTEPVAGTVYRLMSSGNYNCLITKMVLYYE